MSDYRRSYFNQNVSHGQATTYLDSIVAYQLTGETSEWTPVFDRGLEAGRVWVDQFEDFEVSGELARLLNLSVDAYRSDQVQLAVFLRAMRLGVMHAVAGAV